jgi:hypothetical protein
MIATTINAQTKTYLTEKELAKLLQALRLSEEYTTQIFNFFTDVHTQDIEKFQVEFNISDEVLRTYYEKYIKEIYPNKKLEEMIYW